MAKSLDLLLAEQVAYYRAVAFDSFWRLVDRCLEPDRRVFWGAGGRA